MSKSRILAALGLMLAAAPLSAQSLRQIEEDYTVTVRNDSDAPATVYLDAFPFERTLGKVAAMGTATFSLPDHLVRGKETVRLLVHPRGGLPIEARGMVGRSEDHAHLALTLPNKESDDALMLVAVEHMADAPSVTVHNHEGESAEVFFTTGSVTHHLGRIDGDSVETFRLPEGRAYTRGQIVLARAFAPALSTAIWFDGSTHASVLLD